MSSGIEQGWLHFGRISKTTPGVYLLDHALPRNFYILPATILDKEQANSWAASCQVRCPHYSVREMQKNDNEVCFADERDVLIEGNPAGNVEMAEGVASKRFTTGSLIPGAGDTGRFDICHQEI